LGGKKDHTWTNPKIRGEGEERQKGHKAQYKETREGGIKGKKGKILE